MPDCGDRLSPDDGGGQSRGSRGLGPARHELEQCLAVASSWEAF